MVGRRTQGSQANPKGLTYVPPDPGGGQSAIDLILSVVALAILTPVLIFIATATRLSAARREERFAAMRLVGATRRQVSLLAATESTVAGVLGVAVGFGIFFLLRIPVAGIPFIGAAVLPRRADAQPAGHPRGRDRRARRRRRGGPAGAAPGAHLPARRRPPGDATAAAGLAGGAAAGRPGRARLLDRPRPPDEPSPGRIQAFVSSFALIIVGLFLAGPWLTMAAARVMARWTSRPGTLIAARRLADDPRAAFRAVSGLVLALFITTVAVVAITTQNAKHLTRWRQRR